MIRLKAIVIIFLTLFVSCTDDLPQPSPVPVSIEPNFMIQGEQSVVIIHGFDFFPSVHISHNNSSDSQLSSFFRLFLGGFELMNVNYIDTRTLAARVPAGIAVGSYDLIVIDPEGRIGILTNAFNVTITCAGDLDCQDESLC